MFEAMPKRTSKATVSTTKLNRLSASSGASATVLLPCLAFAPISIAAAVIIRPQKCAACHLTAIGWRVSAWLPSTLISPYIFKAACPSSPPPPDWDRRPRKYANECRAQTPAQCAVWPQAMRLELVARSVQVRRSQQSYGRRCRRCKTQRLAIVFAPAKEHASTNVMPARIAVDVWPSTNASATSAHFSSSLLSKKPRLVGSHKNLTKQPAFRSRGLWAGAWAARKSCGSAKRAAFLREK
jgi:hypothetical protein